MIIYQKELLIKEFRDFVYRNENEKISDNNIKIQELENKCHDILSENNNLTKENESLKIQNEILLKDLKEWHEHKEHRYKQAQEEKDLYDKLHESIEKVKNNKIFPKYEKDYQFHSPKEKYPTLKDDM